MLTTPRKRSKSSPKGDHLDSCAYCGATFYRSQLVRKENGMLACRVDCAKGRDEVQLSRLNAEHAASRIDKTVGEGGVNHNAVTLPVIQRTTAADILRYLS
jgi:hypothetical protein